MVVWVVRDARIPDSEKFIQESLPFRIQEFVPSRSGKSRDCLILISGIPVPSQIFFGPRIPARIFGFGFSRSLTTLIGEQGCRWDGGGSED